MEELPPSHGELPPWDTAPLPSPPPFGLRGLTKVIGPGAVMAATSIGGGEWLVGPATAVKYSTDIFLIATVAIVLQVVFNLEAIRYTLYTGEPIYGGIMRLRPGPRFWAGFYSLLGFFQLGWPAFWILFKTQLGNTDILVRTVSDVIWMSSARVREWRSGIRSVYYGILAVFSIWCVIVVRSASPFQLFKLLANMAGLVLAIAGVQVFLVNRRFLPRALRPGVLTEAVLLSCSAFYAFFSFFVFRDLIKSLLR